MSTVFVLEDTNSRNILATVAHFNTWNHVQGTSMAQFDIRPRSYSSVLLEIIASIVGGD